MSTFPQPPAPRLPFKLTILFKRTFKEQSFLILIFIPLNLNRGYENTVVFQVPGVAEPVQDSAGDDPGLPEQGAAGPDRGCGGTHSTHCLLLQVDLSIYPSSKPYIHISIYLSIHLSSYRSIYLSLYIRISIYLLSFHLSIYPSTQLSSYLSIYTSIQEAAARQPPRAEDRPEPGPGADHQRGHREPQADNIAENKGREKNGEGKQGGKKNTRRK